MPGFPGSSAGKESTCNAGDPGLIPRLGRSPGEGIGYPRQYSWDSLVAQMVKNPLSMQETWVQHLGWEDPLEEGMATHSSILAWRSPWTEAPRGLQSTGLQRVGHDWATAHTNTKRGGTLNKAFSVTLCNDIHSKKGCQWKSINQNIFQAARETSPSIPWRGNCLLIYLLLSEHPIQIF